MAKKTRKSIKKLTKTVEDLRDQNEELSGRLIHAIESQSREIQALAQVLTAQPGIGDTDVPADNEEPEDEPETTEATEAAERKAEELDVDLSEVEGSGTEGRIVVSDVEETAEDED